MTPTLELARAIVEAADAGRSVTTSITGPISDATLRLARELVRRAACSRCGYDASARVSATWTFTIERDPPSLNARIHNAGASRWKYRPSATCGPASSWSRG